MKNLTHKIDPRELTLVQNNPYVEKDDKAAAKNTPNQKNNRKQNEKRDKNGNK